MCRFVFTAALLAGGILRAEGPWIGTWNVVWASESFDNPYRITISKSAAGLRLIGKDQPEHVLRRVDGNTAEYTAETEGQMATTICTVSQDGKELTQTTRLSNHSHAYVYDRMAAGNDANDRMAGVWIRNAAKTTVREGGSRTFAVSLSGGLRFQGGMRYTAEFDGKDYPVTGSATTQKVSLRRIDGRTFEEVFKDGAGKELNVRRVAVSQDGTEMTFTHVGAVSSGRGHRLLVLRKQP